MAQYACVFTLLLFLVKIDSKPVQDTGMQSTGLQSLADTISKSQEFVVSSNVTNEHSNSFRRFLSLIEELIRYIHNLDSGDEVATSSAAPGLTDTPGGVTETTDQGAVTTTVVPTTTKDPMEVFCENACKEGMAGPECGCPGHPIG